MTGFDNLMRSQQFAQQSAMGYDQMRTGVAQNTNQMIVQGAQNFAQIQLQQKQLNSTVRLQQAEAQRQLSLSKLADMEIVDMTDMRRAQVKSMQYDEQLKALQVEDAKYRSEQMRGSEAQKVATQSFKDLGGLDYMLTIGMVPKEGVVPTSLSDFREGTDEEVAAYRKRQSKIPESANQNRLLQKDEQARLKAILDETDAPEDYAAWLRSLGTSEENIAKAIQDRYQGGGGGGAPQGLPSTQQMTPEQQEAQSYINKFNLNIGPGGLPLYEPRIAQQLGMAMVAKKADIAKAFREETATLDNETVKKWTDEQIMDYYTTILRDPNDPRAMKIAIEILED